MDKPKNEDSPPTENGLQQIYQDQNAKLRNTVLATCGRFATEFRDSFKADRSSPTLQVAPQNQASLSSSADVAEDVILEAYKDAEARNELSHSQVNDDHLGCTLEELTRKPSPSINAAELAILAYKDAKTTEELSQLVCLLSIPKSSLSTNDKVKARRVQAKDLVSEQIRAGKRMENMFNEYVQVQTLLRSILNENPNLIYGVHTNDFERSLIEYYVENKHERWDWCEKRVESILTRLERNHQADTPQDKQLRLKIRFLFGSLWGPRSSNLLIVQDITAISDLYENKYASKIENEYMDLIFNPERSPLKFMFMSPDVQLKHLTVLKAPRWSQDFMKEMLDGYVERQSEIRFGDSLERACFEQTLDEHFNQLFLACKEDYNEVWTNNQSDLIDSYVEFWTWQRDELKEALKTDQQHEKHILHLYLTEAMVNQPLNHLSDYVLCFDAHQLKRLQDELYESPNLDQLIETKEFYFHMIFGSDRWL